LLGILTWKTNDLILKYLLFFCKTTATVSVGSWTSVRPRFWLRTDVRLRNKWEHRKGAQLRSGKQRIMKRI
jgi:hypothetical protein